MPSNSAESYLKDFNIRAQTGFQRLILRLTKNGQRSLLCAPPLLHEAPPGPRWIWAVRFEMAGGKGKDLKKRLYGQDDIARGPLRRAGTVAAFIGAADERQPQARFLPDGRRRFGRTCFCRFRKRKE